MRRSGAILALSFLLLSSSCAKTGDPHPPFVRIPKPAVDLDVRQYGTTAVLTFSAPAVNTDGTAVKTLDRVEVFRLEVARAEPPADPPEEEFLRRAQRILDLAAADLARYQRGGTVVVEDALEPAAPAALPRNAFRYAVRFVNKSGQTVGLGNRAYLAPVAVAPPPSALSFELAQEYVRLRWTPSTSGAAIAGYNVYRAEEGQEFGPAPRNKEPVAGAEFEDREFEFDKTYRYAVSVVASLANPYAESRPSAPLRIATRDTFPPAPPRNLEAVHDSGRVFLFWTASPAPDVAGYRVYRRADPGGELERIQAEPIAQFSFRDEHPPAGRKVEYIVRAVDRHGNEGPPETAALEIP
jgi:hypothetical protein